MERHPQNLRDGRGWKRRESARREREGTPADLACTTDAGKRDAGEAKKGVREDDRDREQDG